MTALIFFFSFWIGFICVWNFSSSVLLQAQGTLEVGSGGAGLSLPFNFPRLVYLSHFPRLVYLSHFPQAGSLPRPGAPLVFPPHSTLVEHLSQSFSFAVWGCTGKGGNGEKWERRDTGSPRNLPEEHLLCWHCWDLWAATGEICWALTGLSWTWSVLVSLTGGSTTARMLSRVAGHTWTNSGVLQALARAGRAPRPHGTALGALQHELIPREWRTEEEAAGWADADPAKQVPAQTHQNLGQIDFKPMARSVWWCCSSVSVA